MNGKAKHPQADNDTPEVARKKRNIEKRCAGQTVKNRNQCIKQGQDERIASEVSSHLGIPCRSPEAVPVKYASLSAIDDHAPETYLSNDFIQRPLAHKEFLC